MSLKISSSSDITLVITDVSIKNNVTTSITHIHIYNRLIKTLHHTVNVTFTEAKLFAIRYCYSSRLKWLSQEITLV